jgi:hypothetical protein
MGPTPRHISTRLQMQLSIPVVRWFVKPQPERPCQKQDCGLRYFQKLSEVEEGVAMPAADLLLHRLSKKCPDPPWSIPVGELAVLAERQ